MYRNFGTPFILSICLHSFWVSQFLIWDKGIRQLPVIAPVISKVISPVVVKVITPGLTSWSISQINHSADQNWNKKLCAKIIYKNDPQKKSLFGQTVTKTPRETTYPPKRTVKKMASIFLFFFDVFWDLFERWYVLGNRSFWREFLIPKVCFTMLRWQIVRFGK